MVLHRHLVLPQFFFLTGDAQICLHQLFHFLLELSSAHDVLELLHTRSDSTKLGLNLLGEIRVDLLGFLCKVL